MPAAVIAAIIAGGATATGQIVSAKLQSGAAKKSAQLQTTSANYAADKQAEATQKALDFQQAEAAKTRADAEVTRHANYDQWAAQQRRLGTLGQLLGMAPPEIPGYVPLDAGAGTLGAALPPTGANRSGMPSGAAPAKCTRASARAPAC